MILNYITWMRCGCLFAITHKNARRKITIWPIRNANNLMHNTVNKKTIFMCMYGGWNWNERECAHKMLTFALSQPKETKEQGTSSHLSMHKFYDHKMNKRNPRRKKKPRRVDYIAYAYVCVCVWTNRILRFSLPKLSHRMQLRCLNSSKC